jgi:hypothetical protein
MWIFFSFVGRCRICLSFLRNVIPPGRSPVSWLFCFALKNHTLYLPEYLSRSFVFNSLQNIAKEGNISVLPHIPLWRLGRLDLALFNDVVTFSEIICSKIIRQFYSVKYNKLNLKHSVCCMYQPILHVDICSYVYCLQQQAATSPYRSNRFIILKKAFRA